MAPPRKILGVFQLIMINVIAVDSIRSLSFSAVYGYALISFYLIAAIFFFIPSALVSAELGTGWPTTGGVYLWVREAFGKKWSLFVIWLNWIYNLAWYPTIMALLGGTFAYLFDPDLVNNKLYMASAILIFFWLATLLNCFGMKISSAMSTVGALIGTLLPMVFITILAIFWIAKGNPLQASFSWKSLLPDLSSMNNLAFLTNVLFGLLGLEMSTTHALDVRNPKKDFPKAIFISAAIILATLVFSSLSIAIVVPKDALNLVTGALQAFVIFFDAFGLSWMVPLIAIAIILGGISAVGAWIIGPTKGIMVASKDGSLPAFLSKTNRHGVPVTLLLVQAVIVSILCLAFVLMPTVNSSFWLLSAITAQLALVVYIFLFVSALKLHHVKPHVERSFKVPGGKIGMWITCCSGALISLLVIIVGFIPPEQIAIKNIWAYEGALFGGMAGLGLLPALYLRLRKSA